MFIVSRWQPREPPEPQYEFRGTIIVTWDKVAGGTVLTRTEYCDWRQGLWQPDLTEQEQRRLVMMRREIDERKRWWSDELDILETEGD